MSAFEAEGSIASWPSAVRWVEPPSSDSMAELGLSVPRCVVTSFSPRIARG